MTPNNQNNSRIESDSMGDVEVPEDVLWGAQTQRSLKYFNIGSDLIPMEVIWALALVKQAAAFTNQKLGKLEKGKADLIIRAAEEILEGKLDHHFPLRVWMTGSGTQANMNVNEVISNRAIQLAGGALGSKEPVHPNDHVNMSQSTNDVFPTAMHIATAMALKTRLIPQVKRLANALHEKAEKWKKLVKIGRTHLQDAVPLTLGQELSGYVVMLEENLARIGGVFPELYRLAIGGTAVGTGLNAPKGFAEGVSARIAEITGMPFTSAPNKFAVMGAHDAVIMASGVLKILASSLYKISNDIRLLASGPNCGLQELVLPSNEPGSSIMPGKINPTQCEAMAMVAVQVMGYDTAVGFGGAGGYLEMNVYKPMIIFNLLKSVEIISDSCRNFTDYLVVDLQVNEKQIERFLNSSPMLVTPLSPVIGYEKAAQIAHLAMEREISLKEACLELGYLSGEEFDRIVDAYQMAHPHS
jgi:fumarate hydratase class II